MRPNAAAKPGFSRRPAPLAFAEQAFLRYSHTAFSGSFINYFPGANGMSLLVTGSIGLDTLETPTGKRENVIGGSAIYFSYAASFFTPVRLIGVVGEDFPMPLFDFTKSRDIDTAGLEVRKGSKTFRWHGSYLKD